MTSNSFFFKNDTIGKEGRQQKQMNQILHFLSKSDKSLTVPEISKYVGISVPTTIKLVGLLLENSLILDEGKKDTNSGRKPTLYSINKELLYSVGVEINLKGIKIGLYRIDFEFSDSWESMDFELENNKLSLEIIVKSISEFIETVKIGKNQILGVGIGITGRVNSTTGQSLSFFDFMGVSFAEYIQKAVGLPVFVDNDSRVLGLAELVVGKAKGVSNAIVLNVSRGLGMCIIANGGIISGGMGFAGEFGHMQFGVKGRLCLCGKQNCLGTEVSGYSLEEDYNAAISKGKESIIDKNDDISYIDILEAALKGDSLCIDLLQRQGGQLGDSLGNIINLLNPTLVVIGGEFAVAKDVFLDAIRIGMKRSGLINSIKYCKVVNSNLSHNAVMKGASALVFEKLQLL